MLFSRVKKYKIYQPSIITMVLLTRVLLMQSGRGRIPMIRFRKGAPPDHQSASAVMVAPEGHGGDTIVVGGIEMKIINPECVFPPESLEELYVPDKYKRRMIGTDEIDQVNRGGVVG